MKSQIKRSAKKTIASAARNVEGKSVPAKVRKALTGTTGVTLLSAAAAGVAGFLIYRNRETILNFIGKYVDLPESLKSSSESESWDSTGSEASRTKTYTSPTTEQRM